MPQLRAAYLLYVNAAKSAFSGFFGTLLALGVLIVGAVCLVGVEMLFLEPMGANSLMAGVCRAAAGAVFVSTYLSLINMWVQAKRTTLFRHLRLHAGNLFLPLLYLLFFFLLVRWAAAYIPHPMAWILVIVAGVIANPGPEIVYQERGDGFGTVQQAAQFMSQNWPEWLAMQVPFAALFGAWAVVARFSMLPEDLGRLWLDSGPRPEILHITSFYLQKGLNNDMVSPIMGLLLLVLFHGWMLFRGYVFRELNKGNRRLRAWQSRM